MAKTRGKAKDRQNAAEEASNRIFTVPNVISAIRLCLVPVFLVLLLHGYDLMATFLYALAAGTDWIDGQIARRTHTVSKLGQLLDPAVDRILMIAGVAGLFVVGRLPLWIILVVLLRDLLLLVGGALLIKAYRIRVAVVFPGQGGHHLAVRRVRGAFAQLAPSWRPGRVRRVVASRLQRRFRLLGHLVRVRRARAGTGHDHVLRERRPREGARGPP